MYAGRVACCRLVSDVEYAPRSVLTLRKDGTDRLKDGTVRRMPDRCITQFTLLFLFCCSVWLINDDDDDD